MDRFPAELADLFSEEGRAWLRGRRGDETRRRFESPDAPAYVGLPGLLEPALAQACHALLDRTFSSVVVDVAHPMPAHRQWHELDARWRGTQRNRSIFFPPVGPSRALAEEIGLLPMMRSSSIVELAYQVTGLPLFVPHDQSAQVSVYGHGDHVGPHCDRLGTATRTHPYIDFHISLPNPHVGSQWLMYEGAHGYLSGMADLNQLGFLGIYRLPLWHQVTPLVAVPGREAEARRWLIMGYQNIAGHDYHWVGRDFADFPEDRQREPLHASGLS